MSILLDFVYLLAAVVASPWLAYRLLARGDWKELSGRFGAGLGESMSGCVWLHGSSAGEIALLAPLVRLLEQSEIDSPLVISAYSATGYAAARNAFPGHRVIVFPFDFSFIVRRTLRHLNPRLIVIVESEFWPNFLREANRSRVAVAVVNGKMSAKSFRFYARTLIVPMLLRRLSLFAVQASVYAERLHDLGIPQDRIRVTGNMKYDLARIPDSLRNQHGSRAGLGYIDDDVVIIGGSVHDREDAALLDAFSRIKQERAECCLVIAPRYPRDATRIERIAAELGLQTIRKTSINAGSNAGAGRRGVLIVDTVGELRGLYGIADIAFVGGSLFYRGSNKGGHNLMEPAVVGVPVIFGPHNFSFEETARELMAAQAGFQVRDAEELAEILRRLCESSDLRKSSGACAQRVIEAGQGATQENFELLAPLIDAAGLRLPAQKIGPTMPPAA